MTLSAVGDLKGFIGILLHNKNRDAGVIQVFL